MVEVVHLTKCYFDHSDLQQKNHRFCDKQVHFGSLGTKMLEIIKDQSFKLITTLVSKIRKPISC